MRLFCILYRPQSRTVLKVKPFPDTLPITIATYENAEDKLVPELAKVSGMVETPEIVRGP